MHNKTTLGLFVGLLVAIAVSAAGFAGFVWAIIFGVIGLAVGAQLDGEFDFREFIDNFRSGRGGRG